MYPESPTTFHVVTLSSSTDSSSFVRFDVIHEDHSLLQICREILNKSLISEIHNSKNNWKSVLQFLLRHDKVCYCHRNSSWYRGLAHCSSKLTPNWVFHSWLERLFAFQLRFWLHGIIIKTGRKQLQIVHDKMWGRDLVEPFSNTSSYKNNKSSWTQCLPFLTKSSDYEWSCPLLFLCHLTSSTILTLLCLTWTDKWEKKLHPKFWTGIRLSILHQIFPLVF